MTLVLKWILFFPIVIGVNLFTRVPIAWIFTNVTDSSNVDIKYSWLAIVLIGVRDNLATYFTLYVALKFMNTKMKMAFYIGSAIAIMIAILSIIIYPIKFTNIGFWSSIGELALLGAQAFGTYKAIRYISDEFYFEIYKG